MTTVKTYLLTPVTVLLLMAIFAGAVSAQDAPLPAPTGVAAANGNAVGEAIVSWNAVPGAAFYRIGWVAFPDYQATVSEGRDWLEAFHFLDAANTGQTQWTLSRLSPGVPYYFIVASNDARNGTPQYGNWSERITLTPALTPTPTPTPAPAPSAASCLPVQSIGTFTGSGNDAGNVLYLAAGQYRVTAHQTGKSNYIVDLIPTFSISILAEQLLVNVIGTERDDRTFSIGSRLQPAGVYALEVAADGDWTLTITKYGGAD